MKIFRMDTVNSTNEVAKDLIAEGAEPWTVVVAVKQVEGRGRLGRRWVSPRGGLYVTIVNHEALERLPVVSLSAGISIAAVLDGEGITSSLHWPNDVFVGDRKIAGVLTEGLTDPPRYWGIVGIGVNSNSRRDDFPKELRGHVTTMRHELGREVDNDALLDALLGSLRDNYPSQGVEQEVLERYRRRCETLDQDVVIETSKGVVRGRAVDLNPAGFLIVETEGEERVEVAEGTVVRRA